MTTLVTRIESLLGGDAIVSGRDAASFLATTPPKGTEPLVLAPASSDEVERILETASGSEVPVFVAGSSSRGMDWSRLPRGRSVVLDMRRLDALLAIDETSLTVTVQSGMACARLERMLAKKGYSLGFGLTGFAERVSVGGLLATGLPPLASLKRGTLLEHVVNVGFALPDGTRVRTRIAPRAATGPDLDAMVIGLRGALGVITEATLRMYALPEETQLCGFGFRTTPEALLGLGKLVAAGLTPTFAGVWPAAPGAKRGARLATQFTGSADEVKALVTAVKKKMKEEGARLDPKPDESWFAHADAAAARLHGDAEPVWAWGTFEALARAAAEEALAAEDADFGVPAFDRSGGYAVASAGASAPKRIAALRRAGCRILSAGRALPEPLDPATREIARRVKAVLDPAGRLNPGVLDGPN